MKLSKNFKHLKSKVIPPDIVLAVFWRAIGFDCHMMLILMFNLHHAVTSALVRKQRCCTWEYRWQASAEQLSCLVVCWHMAMPASAIGLMFGGNPNVIIGSGSLAVVLLMEPAPGGI